MPGVPLVKKAVISCNAAASITASFCDAVVVFFAAACFWSLSLLTMNP